MSANGAQSVSCRLLMTTTHFRSFDLRFLPDTFHYAMIAQKDSRLAVRAGTLSPGRGILIETVQ